MAEAQTKTEVVRFQKRVAKVVSTGGDKTIRVVVDNLTKHPKYGKFIHRRTKLAVHDQTNMAKLGDMVEIVPCRRLSKSKAWRLLRVVRSGNVVAENPA
jgi:small subunit ribosomal protein S17